MTPPVPKPTAENLSHDLAALRAAVDEARDRAREGSPLDLAGLEAQAAALCDAVLALPRDRAEPLTAALAGVLAALDPLAQALTAQHTAVADTLAAAAQGRADPHTARQRAAAVYGRPGPAVSAEAPAPSLSDDPA